MKHYPLNIKFLKKEFLIEKPKSKKKKKFSENFIFSRFLMLPQQTTESAACTIYPTPTEANMVYPDIFLQK